MNKPIRVKEGNKWTKVSRWQEGKEGAVIYSIGQFTGVARKGHWMQEEDWKKRKDSGHA